MSQASDNVQEVVDHFTGLAHGSVAAVDIYAAMLPQFVTLILERLDNIANEIRHANNKGAR